MTMTAKVPTKFWLGEPGVFRELMLDAKKFINVKKHQFMKVNQLLFSPIDPLECNLKFCYWDDR